MKIILTLFFFFLLFHSQSQPMIVNQSHGNSTVEDILTISDNEFVVLANDYNNFRNLIQFYMNDSLIRTIESDLIGLNINLFLKDGLQIGPLMFAAYLKVYTF